jgi:hypothetical protein
MAPGAAGGNGRGRANSAPVAARFLPAEATAPRWTVHGCTLVRDGKFAVKTLKDAGGKTTGYSQNGSSSHAALLALLERHKVDARPVSTGRSSRHGNDRPDRHRPRRRPLGLRTAHQVKEMIRIAAPAK